jgi:tagatose 1,6-diphosphate aldolase
VELARYTVPAVPFDDFLDGQDLSHEDVHLICVKKTPTMAEKSGVPAYLFDIVKDEETVGGISLRLGRGEALSYRGNIGYTVFEDYRGQGVAVKACRALVPLMKAHGMTTAVITNDEHNAASRRVCEKLGARRVAMLPKWIQSGRDGERGLNVFVWDV